MKLTDIPGLFAKNEYEAQIRLLFAFSQHMEKLEGRVDSGDVKTPQDVIADLHQWFIAAQMTAIYEAYSGGYFTREQALEGIEFLHGTNGSEWAERTLTQLEQYDGEEVAE